MPVNQAPQDLYNAIVNDFHGGWDSIASNPNLSIGRCNFLFGLQATILLELVCKICASDRTGSALRDLSSELSSLDAKYFTKVPNARIQTSGFKLPRTSSPGGDELLSVIFDLVRNGQAHQYQQIVANIGPNTMTVALAGPSPGRNLATSRNPRPTNHLGFMVNPAGDISVILYPDVLFLDVEEAVTTIGLFSGGLSFPFFARSYRFTSNSIQTVLHAAGHTEIPRS
jgi:hypothetical protein